jgi:hypothetical protein
MNKEIAIEIINNKLKSLGFELIINDVKSKWGANPSDLRYTINNENIPLLMKSFMRDAKIEINITFDPEYHDTYNTDPSICIMANVLFWHYKNGKVHDGRSVVQIYCRYSLNKCEWVDKTLIGDNIYNLK